MNPAHGAWRRCEKIVACVLDGSEDSETRAKSRRRRRGERGLTAWRTAPRDTPHALHVFVTERSRLRPRSGSCEVHHASPRPGTR